MRRQLPIHVGLVCVCGLALTAVVLVALGSPDQPRPVTAQEPELPEADGAAVLDYILNQNPYTEWGSWPPDRWTDFGGLVPGGPPHGNTVRIFVNDIALEAAAAEDFDGLLPPGSLIVKENYNGSVDDPGDLAALTIMYKVEGYNPDAGDWFWVKAAGDGSAIDAEGAPEDCTGCHGQAGNADYMLRYAFGDEPVAIYSEPLPEADGAALMDYILNVDPYTDWGSWPATGERDFSGYLAGGEPHGATVRIFVNARALAAIARENFDGLLPPGSIVVKENYTGTVDDPGDLAALTIMYKVAGYNPDANDWFWVKAAGDGSAIDAEGMVEGCIGCHGQAGSSDYLLGYILSAPAEEGEAGAEMGGLDGNALIDERCTECHGRGRIDKAEYDRAGWEENVDRMIGLGANLNDEERAAVIDYLANR